MKTNSIKKNFTYNLIYQLLVVIFPLFTSPYISRVLGAEGLGVYTYTYSVANYFVVFSMLGISTYGNRSISRVRDDRDKLNRTFSSILCTHLIISVIVFICYIIYLVFFVKSNFQIALLQIFFVASSIFDINWFFFGIERFDLTVKRNIVIKISTIIMIFAFVNTKNDLWLYTLIMSLGILISQSYIWIYIRKFVTFEKTDMSSIKKNIKPLLLLFIPVIAISIYKLMDKIMLGSMTNIVEVGFYENAEKIINIPTSLITALGTVMLPKICNLSAKGDKKTTLKYIEYSFEFVTLIGSAIAFGILSIGDIFAPLFFGNEFIETGNIIKYLAISILFISWADVIRMQFLIPKKKDSIYILSMVMGAVINLILNLILIPQCYAVGAAIATLAAEATVFFIQMSCTVRDLAYLSYLKKCYFYIFNGFLMFIVITFLKQIFGDEILDLILLISIGAVLYTVNTIVYMYFSKCKLGKKILTIVKKKR